MLKPLKKREFNSFLKQHPEWKANPKGNEIRTEVKFSDYIDGLVIMARIAVHAEILKHHPDITYSYHKLIIKLKTHQLKAVTKLDTALAARIDKILGREC